MVYIPPLAGKLVWYLAWLKGTWYLGSFGHLHNELNQLVIVTNNKLKNVKSDTINIKYLTAEHNLEFEI